MCWSFTVSALFAIIGLGFAGYLAYKKESKFLWIPLAYFGLMEVLQALSYFYIGQCFSPTNQMLTYLSYLHIVFQPIFINVLLLYFIPEKFRNKIIVPVLAIASLVSVFLLIGGFPFDWAGTCQEGSLLCGESLCTEMGNWHLAWDFPLNGLGFGFNLYLLAIIVLPIIYGSWRLALYGLITGPVLSYALTSNPNEWPAVWCLWSVAIILVMLIPWARERLKVKKWYFWKYPK